MSKWRYEVTSKNCDYFDRPRYVYPCEESMINYFKMFGDCTDVDYLWRLAYANKVILKPTYNGFGDILFGEYSHIMNVEKVFPAKRLGRMFPRHKQQITYKEVI